MARFDDATARQLDFGETGVPVGLAALTRSLRLASRGLRGPDKYRLLEHRRRQAQIRARRTVVLLERVALFEMTEQVRAEGPEGEAQ